jgi:hypothetical protein
MGYVGAHHDIAESTFQNMWGTSPCVTLFGLLLGISLANDGSSQAPKPNTRAAVRKALPSAARHCFSIGDTITVTGQATFPNGATDFALYQPRAEGLCIHYPKPTDHSPLTDLGTIGTKLPQNVSGGSACSFAYHFPVSTASQSRRKSTIKSLSGISSVLYEGSSP